MNVDYSGYRPSSQHLRGPAHGPWGLWKHWPLSHSHKCTQTHTCMRNFTQTPCETRRHCTCTAARAHTHTHTLTKSQPTRLFKNHWISSCLSVWKQESLAEEVNDPDRQRTPHWELRTRKSFEWAHPHQLKGDHTKSQSSHNTVEGHLTVLTLWWIKHVSERQDVKS